MQRSEAKADDTRLTGLELLRFLCAVAVLLWHYNHFGYIGTQRGDLPEGSQPLYEVLAPFYHFGNLGVEVFWSISGFIFYWKYRQMVARQEIDARTFFWLRASRLYPLHLATLLAVIPLQSAYSYLSGDTFVYGNNDLPHFLAQLVLASDWGFLNGFSFNGPIWSVSIEVLLYVAFFVLARYTALSARWTLGLLLVALPLHAFHLAPYNPSKGFLFFFLGGATALLYDECLKTKTTARITDALSAAVIGAAACWALLYQMQVAPALHPTLVLLALIPALLLILTRHVQLIGLSGRIADKLGSLTYSSYLLHFPVQLTIVTVYKAISVEVPAQSVALLAAYMGATMALAVFTFKYFEMPSQRMIRRRTIRNTK